MSAVMALSSRLSETQLSPDIASQTQSPDPRWIPVVRGKQFKRHCSREFCFSLQIAMDLLNCHKGDLAGSGLLQHRSELSCGGQVWALARDAVILECLPCGCSLWDTVGDLVRHSSL